MNILWTEQALACLAEIEDFIARDDPVAAVVLIEKLIDRTDILHKHPHAGRQIPEIPGSPLRELVESNYRLVYRIRTDVIEILTVFESHRVFHGVKEENG